MGHNKTRWIRFILGIVLSSGVALSRGGGPTRGDAVSAMAAGRVLLADGAACAATRRGEVVHASVARAGSAQPALLVGDAFSHR